MTEITALSAALEAAQAMLTPEFIGKAQAANVEAARYGMPSATEVAIGLKLDLADRLLVSGKVRSADLALRIARDELMLCLSMDAEFENHRGKNSEPTHSPDRQKNQ